MGNDASWIKLVLCSVALLLIVGCSGGGGGDVAVPPVDTWSVTRNGDILEIDYGKEGVFPQYGALHLDSGYFRLNYGPGSGWGTSVVLTPSFWSGGTYYQGARVAHTWKVDGGDLLITFSGTISTLTIQGEVRLFPPADKAIAAQVSVTTNGTLLLDNRPGEAFKPVMLSSMHISSDQWDAQSAFAGLQTYPIPDSGWIIFPPVDATVFGLTGGTSLWKTNAPTVEIVLAQPATITGWVTNSGNPNDDNLGLWAATDVVLANWTYTINTKAP